MTRRTVIGTLAAAAAASAQRPHKEWKPKLGLLGPFTEANVAFAKQEGFTNMILGASPGSSLDAAKITDEQIEHVKSTLAKYQMHVSALQLAQNHISPDADKHARETEYFTKAIELAGKLGIPYVGTCSGKDTQKPFQSQVDDIVRVYNEKYFAACEKHDVKILWEPWPGGPNLAVSPGGFEALFKGFGSSPYVGLQYDPSHLVWQMMDPIQTAREFVDKIYDVHLKDTEIRWDIVRRWGVFPVKEHTSWWSYRLPGLGSINWSEFFTVLQRAGYTGAMSVEHEDPFYDDDHHGPDFSEDYKTGFKMAHRYLRQYVPD